MFTRIPDLLELSRGVALPTYPGISKTTASAVDKHNEQANALTEAIATVDDYVKRAVDTAADVSVDTSGFELGDAIDLRRGERLRLHQEVCRLWLQRGQLAQAMADDLAPHLETAAATYTDALHATLEGLDRLGLGPASMMAGSNNAQAAQRQQEAIAKLAAPVRTAAAAEHDARVRYNAAVEASTTSKRRLEESRVAVRRIAERAAAAV